MNTQAQRKLLSRLISALAILSLCVNLLPPPLPAAALSPSLPDYSAQLLAISGTLERDDRGGLRFSYAEVRPTSERETTSPHDGISLFGQNSWLSHLFAAVGLTSSAQSPPAQDPPVQDAPLTTGAHSQSQTDALPDPRVFLPLINGNTTTAAPLGEKPVLQTLLPDPAVLATDLGFSLVQIQHVQAVIDSERAAIAALDAQASGIIGDEQKTLQEKQAAIASMEYNDRLRASVQRSLEELQQRLGASAYIRLVEWSNNAWWSLVSQHNAVRTAPASISIPLPVEPCPTFTVFATRSIYTDYSVDLPDKYIKFANRGIEYSHGYTSTAVYSVSVQLNTQVISSIVITDVGPHNEDDNYWNTPTDPLHPRRMYADLPQGVPEAEAAYFGNYNNGQDQFGRVVTNPAGINLSETLARQLGMVGNQWVSVTFPWDCVPQPPTSHPIERSWGSNDWSPSAAHLVNPVTGNQSLWARDLYVSAPGLPIDIVRYYNSLDGADGIFGRGWSSEFDMRVDPQPDGSYKVRYADGQRASFRPDGVGFSGEPGVFDTFAVDGTGFVLTLADEQITYHFDVSGRLQSIQDLAGNQTTLSYTGDNPTTITDSVGRTFTLAFDGNNHVTRIADPAGRVVTYDYAPPTSAPSILGVNAAALTQSAALTGVTDPNQGTTKYEYDPATQALNRAIDADGITYIENLYDEQSRVRQQRNADGRTQNVQYDAQNRRSIVTDNLGNQTIYVYDPKMRVVQEIDALGNRISYAYDDRNQLIAKTDKRGNSWKYGYDARGNATRREDPVDAHSAAFYSADVTTWEYNERNQVTKMTNARGEVTRYEYDARSNLTKVIEPNGATTTSGFNSKGQMTSLIDAEGRITQYGYDAYGNRNEIIDPNGGITRTAYDNAGRVLSQTDAENHTTSYEYDGNGNLIKVTDPLGGVTRSEYNHNNLLTKEIDRRGGVYTYAYDKELNLVETRDPLGHAVRYEYDAMHNRTRIVDANGNSTTYTYDKLYRITSMTDPLGATTRYVYDENDNVVSTTDALGNTTRYTYDALDRRIFVSDALGYKTEMVHDQLDRVTQTIDALGAVSRYEYDSAGDIVRIVNPLGAVTTYAYDRMHNRTRTTDPNGHTSTVVYDGLYRVIAHTDPLSNVVQTGYDKIGNTTVITDANGGVSTFAYNANSWVTRSTDALDAQVSYTYDAEGNQLSITDANGHTTGSVYDLRGDVAAVTDPLGNTTRFTYDANGNRITDTDANGHVTRYEYGAGDLLARSVDALQNPIVYEYDLLGRMIRATDANSKASTYRYDPFDRVVAVIDAKGQATSYTYDALGNLASITDANRITTQFAYNPLNQVITETNSLNKTWLYSYDAAGNLVEKIDGQRQAIRYEYDAADQLIRKSFPDGKAVEYAYDRNGNGIRMADWNGTFTATYDAADQLTSATDYKQRRFAYTYDGIGNRISMIYPDQRSVRYHFNPRNQLTAMDDPDGRTMQYTYDAAGLLVHQVRPNNTRTDFTYDAADRLTSVHTTGPSAAIIGNFDFTLDKVGNRTQVVATRPDDAPVTYSYGYDDLYQLVSARSDTGEALTYTYDAVGNRLNVQGTPEAIPPVPPTAPISTTYQYNQMYSMLRAGNAVLRYDDNGNRVHSEEPLADTKYAELGLTGTLITEYTFDVEDRLVEARETIRYVKEGAGPSSAVVMEADYGYDGAGRRIAKLVQTYNLQGGRLDVLLREYVYDGLDVATEYEYHNGATAPDVTSYYYANGEKVTLERSNANGEQQIYWYAYDAQGSTTALLDTAGQVAAEYQSDEFGRLLTGNSLLNHFLYTGQEYDPETGLYHFFARYYDPDTGVWLGQDVQRGSAMQPGTWHRYAYVLNNPVNMVDELGYWPSWLDRARDKAADLANRYVVQPARQVVEAAKEVAKDAADVVDRYVVKPAVKAVSKVKEEVSKRYQHVKTHVKQKVREVNDRYVKPAREKAATALKTAREGITKAADWVQEHKDTVAMVAGAVGALAAGAVFCGVTAGIGCAVIAGVVGGAIAAGGIQMGANVLDSNVDTDLFDNVGRAALVGGVTGGLDALSGGVAGVALRGGAALARRGAKALAERAAAAAPRALTAVRQGVTAARQGASTIARRAGEGLRSTVRGCNSFSAATPVMTVHGEQPISTIKVGDRVLAYNEVLGETGAYTVTATISHVDQVVEYVAIDGERLETTQEHPFYTRERGWVEADDLWAGAHVYRADGRIGVVQGIEVIKHRQPMYNLTVAQAHTYFVGDGQWLVHNCPVRNPFGRRGGPAHQARVQQAEQHLGVRGWSTVSGGSLPERAVDIAATGGRRFPDLVMERGGRQIAIQVGRVTRAGRPVSRERGPLTELRSTGLFDHVFYLKYP